MSRFTTTRASVYAAISTERQYQEKRWPGFSSAAQDLSAWAEYIERYLSLVKDYDSHNDKPEALEAMRKIAALAVCAMEEHGAPERQA